MRQRNADLAFDWMRSQPRRAFHYRDEIWAALAGLHPDEFAVIDDRKTPWASLAVEMTRDPRFARVGRGLFQLVDGAATSPAESPVVPERPTAETEGTVTGTRASDWELVTPRGTFSAESWQSLLLKVARSFTEQELLQQVGKSAGRVPYVLDVQRMDPDRSRFYSAIGPRVAVFSHVSAERTLAVCKWLTEQVGDEGELVLRRRAVDDLASPSSPAQSEEPDGSRLEPDVSEPRVWIFQANPKFYRILDALQRLDRMRFLTNRYKDRIRVGDIVLIWMSGDHAGIYAQARVVEGVAERKSDGDDAAFWTDPSNGATTRPRVVLAIEKRFLGNPLLRTTIAATEGLEHLMILRQPNGTNFPIDPDGWELLRPLLPTEETREPASEVLPGATKRSGGGKLYDQSCGELLERFVAEAFVDGEEHARDEIAAWFSTNYPRFKPITVQCHIEKYTTNYRSRVHYHADPEHDLLFRVADDWSRIRRYRPGEDPAPIHDQPDAPSAPKSKTSSKAKPLSPVERNRRLLAHLAAFGELVPGDREDLGLDEGHLCDWLDSLLVRRPDGYVVTPLFLHLIEGDPGPCSFTTRLAARFMGEHLRRHAPESLPVLEEHIWTRFGRWHLPQPQGDDPKIHAYLSVPIREARDVAASERLDLFAQLPPTVNNDLIREPDFLAELQSWSADAASKAEDGPLSRQLRRGWKRPLMLSIVELLVADDGQVRVGEMKRADVVERSHVVAGLPLCGSGDWKPGVLLEREAAVERLSRHPVAGAILQLEVHRLFADLKGEAAASIHIAGGPAQLELDGVSRGPLWRHVRALLEQVGYWPVGACTQDALWTSAVQAMLKNLELLDVLERHGPILRLTDAYQSTIKAHPGHLHNRGEKLYRVRLSQFLAALPGGQA
ncbi:MAG: EVE domain-containing protein [Myxococcota bacterium]|jgi:hypothetical protein|nr:EVE domain-containing protein [Myxococcota bacterium]